MRQRLLTALIVATIAVAVGVGVAIYTKQTANLLGICLVTGLIGFVFGLVFRFRLL
jgi:hypothetical protein